MIEAIFNEVLSTFGEVASVFGLVSIDANDESLETYTKRAPAEASICSSS